MRKRMLIACALAAIGGYALAQATFRDLRFYAPVDASGVRGIGLAYVPCAGTEGDGGCLKRVEASANFCAKGDAGVDHCAGVSKLYPVNNSCLQTLIDDLLTTWKTQNGY